MTPTDPTTDHLRAVEEAETGLDTMIEAVVGLEEEGLRQPVPLPGWTRSHVLAHVEVVGEALAVQIEQAARGQQVPFLAGGRAELDRAVESRSGFSHAEHLAALRTLRARHHASRPDADDLIWYEPVTFRQGTVVDVALAWWRETRVHLVDLDCGARPEDAWSRELTEHLVDFLSVRLPENAEIALDAPDEEFSYTVTGSNFAIGPLVRVPKKPLLITGSLVQLTAWLAGREVAEPPTALQGDREVPLPELGPWPSALRSS
ncbi:maleylpyruvate isomerase family mycothiol-dependent enzyme [Ruania suaedae]|uniref:maleylpyruvate isomerase family mycothiol-dependent enzyme n=1 Tax=Ruania suaedae TaxID=2897774 RepID=UPI001E534090|nr:maleylpyruvate isomerase family mycothiol-dependent enzyme [Ruania suaedae]UFU02717.1 maleylpyruvate isomerase family mycothiol-dependent enzyme [Ruania suaedae]